MDKKVILFDIDRTLFDVENYAQQTDEQILSVLSEFDSNLVLEIENEYLNSLSNPREFIPEDLINSLCKRLNANKYSELLEVFFDKKYSYLYTQNVYPEAKDVLKMLSQEYRLGIFSEATLKFQNHKFEMMGLTGFFEKELVFILTAKDNQKVLPIIPNGCLIVDDNRSICKFLIEHGINCVWLNKKGEEPLNCKTITSLSGLLFLI